MEDGKETVYNIEMQTTENRNLPKRTRYYQEKYEQGRIHSVAEFLSNGGDDDLAKKAAKGNRR